MYYSHDGLPPPPPQIFFGRNTTLEHLLHVFESAKPNPFYIAILGAGGIEKTVLGVTFIHHPFITRHFGDFRWFLAFEGVFNAEGLRSILANTFKLDEKKLFPSLEAVASSIVQYILLIRGNF